MKKKPDVKKKVNERTKRLVIQPFNYTVDVIASDNIHASAEKRGIEGSVPGWAAMHVGTNTMLSLIFVPFTAGVRTISHESFHCTWQIMETVGAQHENEVMAYMTSYITGEIYKFLRRVRGSKYKNRTT